MMKCIIPSNSQSMSASFGEAIPKPNQFQGGSNWPHSGGGAIARERQNGLGEGGACM